MRRRARFVGTLGGLFLSGVVTACDGGGGAHSDASPSDAIPTKPREWVWVPFPDAKCRDDSTAGIWINASPPSDNLMIFLEGGGSCWNQHECELNPARISLDGFTTGVGSLGVFDRTDPRNPFADWNVVHVPYCTGDLHAGNNPGFDPGDGIGPQQFVGYTNLEKFLGRIVPTFPHVKKVVHSGFSAGGYGALFTVAMVATKFPSSVDVVLLADSSPGASTAFLPACLQRKKWTTWAFDKTFLAECGADCPDPDQYSLDYPKHLSKAYLARRSGVIETEADDRIRAAWGYTKNDCAVPPTAAPTPMDPETFKAAILDYRAQIAGLVPDGGTPNFGTFYLPGSQHGWLIAWDTLYGASAGGTSLVDWITGIVNGDAPTQVGP